MRNKTREAIGFLEWARFEGMKYELNASIDLAIKALERDEPMQIIDFRCPKCKANLVYSHAADHIRNFMIDNFYGSYHAIARKVEIDFKTILYFVNGQQSAGIDMVEYILNAKGYTLVPVKIEKAKKVMNGGA